MCVFYRERDRDRESEREKIERAQNRVGGREGRRETSLCFVASPDV